MLVASCSGILHELALRYVVLGGQGAVEADRRVAGAPSASRFKDTSLMWLIGVGLNIAAGIVLAIPLVIVTVIVIVPAVIAARGRQLGRVRGRRRGRRARR